jgi:regulator of nucleoside diphosphate kinase
MELAHAHRWAFLFLCKQLEIIMEYENIILSDQDYARLTMLANDELLGDELSRAIVVSADQVPDDVVKMNSRVIYLDESSGLSREVELCFPEGADFKFGKISILSPVGSALLGLRVGQTIEWPFPHGQSRRLKVVSVTLVD